MKVKLISSVKVTPISALETEARIKDTLAMKYIGPVWDTNANLMCEYFATLSDHLKFKNYVRYDKVNMDIEQTDEGLLFHFMFKGDRVPDRGITLDMRTAGTLKSALGILLEPFNH